VKGLREQSNPVILLGQLGTVLLEGLGLTPSSGAPPVMRPDPKLRARAFDFRHEFRDSS
jgi:hypothetical protein